MSKYEVLCKGFNEQEKALNEYWQALQVKAAQITNGLTDYLEYPAKDYQNLDSSTRSPYIYFTKRGEKEAARHFTDLQGSNNAIDFDVLITIESEPGVFPKSLLRVPLHIGFSEGIFKVWSDNPDVKADISSSQPSFIDLYDRIFESLIKYQSQRPIFNESV